MADADELAKRFAKVAGYGDEHPRCPVHRVKLSSVFGCTLCDETDNKASTSACAQEQESYFKVWEHQVLEEYDLLTANERATANERTGAG
jgi:hypothetical protein